MFSVRARNAAVISIYVVFVYGGIWGRNSSLCSAKMIISQIEKGTQKTLILANTMQAS